MRAEYGEHGTQAEEDGEGVGEGEEVEVRQVEQPCVRGRVRDRVRVRVRLRLRLRLRVGLRLRLSIRLGPKRKPKKEMCIDWYIHVNVMNMCVSRGYMCICYMCV